jgi:hypothetical protein
MNEFAPPAASGGIEMSDHHGHLVVIDVHGFEPGVATSNGVRDAVRVTFHDVTISQTTEDTLLFQRVLVNSLRPRVGQKVLGVIGQGMAKPGQNAPWTLEDASTIPQAVSAASAYLRKWEAEMFAPPVAEPTPPQPWGAQPAPAVPIPPSPVPPQPAPAAPTWAPAPSPAAAQPQQQAAPWDQQPQAAADPLAGLTPEQRAAVEALRTTQG